MSFKYSADKHCLSNWQQTIASTICLTRACLSKCSAVCHLAELKPDSTNRRPVASESLVWIVIEQQIIRLLFQKEITDPANAIWIMLGIFPPISVVWRNHSVQFILCVFLEPDWPTSWNPTETWNLVFTAGTSLSCVWHGFVQVN